MLLRDSLTSEAVVLKGSLLWWCIVTFQSCYPPQDQGYSKTCIWRAHDTLLSLTHTYTCTLILRWASAVINRLDRAFQTCLNYLQNLGGWRILWNPSLIRVTPSELRPLSVMRPPPLTITLRAITSFPDDICAAFGTTQPFIFVHWKGISFGMGAWTCTHVH